MNPFRSEQTPASLPHRYKWAADEIVELRLRCHDLMEQNMHLQGLLLKATTGANREQVVATMLAGLSRD